MMSQSYLGFILSVCKYNFKANVGNPTNNTIISFPTSDSTMEVSPGNARDRVGEAVERKFENARISKTVF